MYILGLTTLGDSAATLVRNSEIIAAPEERFSRKNHHCGSPYKGVEFCLDYAEITLKDVAHVGLYWRPWILCHKAMQAKKSALSHAICLRRGLLTEVFRRLAKAVLECSNTPPVVLRENK